jgi:putative selenate reductase
MADVMRTQPFEVLLNWIVSEYEANGSIFGIHRSLFYAPKGDSRSASELFGQRLATPVGPAAGPHTQLAQNIVCAWLSGGRFIELKTVQIMDELEIPRPCIDMADEGYNVEWSQELKLEQSASEYVKAWALIHLLRRLLGMDDKIPFGTIFNMSVGYDLKGVQSAPMTWFMDQLQDASEELAGIQQVLEDRFPQFAMLEIPTQLTNNVTLSTMHGCPPDEIERIARYLLEERGLHTIVKLNPTLLGQETVMHILHDRLGFREIHIPAGVFEKDLQYDRAVELIRSLQETAAARNLFFGVKLSNTLAMHNHKDALPGEEMYMSGRALYPITLNLFNKLSQEFAGGLNVSYSGGADAFNVTDLLAAGARPVTTASELLKPGGYSRLVQFVDQLEQEMARRGAASLAELAEDRLEYLERVAAEALESKRYKKAYHPYDLPKVETGLDLFDCVIAPCVERCAVKQDVPEYAWLIAEGEIDQALQVVLARNPLPGVTGYVCTHLCQTRCTRNNYEEPVAIRALKRYAVEHGTLVMPAPVRGNGRVAVIGSGPSGLAAGYFLALNGVRVTIYEAKDVAGGMLAIAPPFRLPTAVVEEDIARITGLGVEIELAHPITEPPAELLKEGFDAVYIACGFQKDARLGIEGEEGEGVYRALEFLERVARGEEPELGDRVLVIGGGNTAMDAARTARRLIGEPVTVVYRRTEREMPATEEEKEGLFAEGNELLELASPTRIILEDGQVVALECARNRLGEPGPDGRRKPLPIEGSEFQIAADAIIVAIGQQPDILFLQGSEVSRHRNGAVAVNPDTGSAGVPCVYAGGDVARGPAIIIEACADGRRAAEAICRQLGVDFNQLAVRIPVLSEEEIWRVKEVRARKESQYEPALLAPDQRDGFDLIEQTLSEEAARREGARCMQCATLCDKCVEVCPNRANYTYLMRPAHLSLPRLACQDGQLVVAGIEPMTVTQPRQILHVDDFCNECGNCATFCVHHGKPYVDKPRLFLNWDGFRSESDNAFHIEGNTIRRRERGQESRLSMYDGGMAFENGAFSVELSPDWEVRKMSLKEPFTGWVSLREAAEMALILKGVQSSLAFLIPEA